MDDRLDIESLYSIGFRLAARWVASGDYLNYEFEPDIADEVAPLLRLENALYSFAKATKFSTSEKRLAHLQSALPDIANRVSLKRPTSAAIQRSKNAFREAKPSPYWCSPLSTCCNMLDLA